MFKTPIKLIQQGIDTHQFSGAALAIGQNKERLICKVFGHTKYPPDAKMVTKNLLFDIASLTKITVTTMLVLRFIEQGRIHLNDNLGYFFAAPKDKSNITIAQLLTHTSGLPAHILLESACETPSEAVPVILGSKLIATPSTQEVYSCMGFILLGEILQKIAQMPLDILAREEVFDPLGMKKTCYTPKGDALYTEKRADGTWLHGTVHDENARFLNGIAGNAGVFSTIEDMAAFAQMLARGGNTKRGRYLSPQTISMAIQNRTPNMAENRGLGFKLSGGENHFMGDLLSSASFGHTGFTGTSLVVDPSTGIYIVLLTNRVHPIRTQANITRLRNLLHSSIASILYKKELTSND